MRKPIMAGNWKMHKTRDEALQFIYMVNQSFPSNKKVESVIFAPSIFLRCLIKRQGEQLRIGSQNMHYEDNGAFTGEISPLMIKTMGINYVLIGHSERRKYFNESDEIVNLKLIAALKHNMIPFVCCGETLEEYEHGLTEKVLDIQIKKAFANIQIADVENVVIAYEPVWAIGTGKTASSIVANDACKYIRSLISQLYGAEVSEQLRILYGGSVNTKNINDLIAQTDIDGCLVGGASLDPNDFLALTNACL